MEIKAQSVYDRETVKKFAKVTLLQFQIFLLVFDIVYFLLMLSVTQSFIAAFIGLILMTLFIVLLIAVSVNQQYKVLGKFQEGKNYFLFRDNDFTYSSVTTDGGCRDQGIISYSFPVKAIESGDYLYIYIQQNRAFIIDKRTIENGTIDNIRCKLMPILGKKYKIKK